MTKLEAYHEEHRRRLRAVEAGLSGLASLPDKLEKISEQLGDLIRADVRINHLEADQAELKDDVDKLKAQVARWAGALAAAGGLAGVAQYFLG